LQGDEKKKNGGRDSGNTDPLGGRLGKRGWESIVPGEGGRHRKMSCSKVTGEREKFRWAKAKEDSRRKLIDDDFNARPTNGAVQKRDGHVI